VSGWYGWAEIGFSVIDYRIPTITVEEWIEKHPLPAVEVIEYETLIALRHIPTNEVLVWGAGNQVAD